MRSLGPPPDQRPNWSRLNEGQKRYAWEQYQLARVRRGLPIDHPLPTLSDPSLQNRTAVHTSQEAGPSNAPVNNLPADNERSTLADTINWESIGDPFFLDSSETTGMAAVPNSSTNNTATAGSKRPADSSNSAGAAKKSKLPGTGTKPGGDTIVRSGPIERPLTVEHGDIRIYKKVHRFFTYGLAYKILSLPENVGGTTTTHYYMITPLAEIPWDRPFFYMNPSEFFLLPPGARAVSMSCEVFQRNVRVAFKTNATTTDLATLNQNKNTIYSVGLSQSIDGLNVKPTGVEAENPMVVNGLDTVSGHPKRDKSNFNDWVEKFYGVTNDADKFDTILPVHQIGMPFNLEHYFAMVTQKSDPLKSGWPCLQSHIKECDSDATSSKSVLAMTYSPEIGLLRPPIAPIATGNYVISGNVTQLNIPRGTGVHLPRKQHQYIKDGYCTVYNEATNQTWTIPNSNQFTITELIEKAQQFTVGSNGTVVPKSQPSLHIGIQPVPALSSNAIFQISSSADKYTDTQCYWEVVAEMTVHCSTPTYRPLAQIPNCKISERMMQASGSVANERFSMFEGLYLNTRAAVSATAASSIAQPESIADVDA